MPAQPRDAPQIIPRPDVWELGGPAPWADISAADRLVSLDAMVERIAARGEGVYRPSSFRGEPTRESAVLVPLYADPETEQPTLILTRRAPHMRSHRHEMSFPGGRKDDEDESLVHTALREAHEEIALDPSSVQIVGELDRFVTGGSTSLVHPYVGRMAEAPTDLVANPGEVELIRHVPLASLLGADVWREERWTRDGHTITITFFELDGDTIWGATAVMLRQLLTVALGIEGHQIGQNRKEWG